MGGAALITGGGTGVGAATARRLAALGWSVAVNYSRSADAAGAVAEDCRSMGVKAVALKGNVAKDGDCRRIVGEAGEALGGLDLLVNNAGMTRMARLGDLDAQNAADLADIYAVNVVGAYQMARAARSFLAASGRGAIVNVSSVAGVTGMGSSIGYSLSKGALNTLTMTLARLFAPEIRVNAVLPGMIATGWFASNGMGEGDVEGMQRQFSGSAALGAICTADDIAGAIVFAGVEAVRMTGQFLTVDAGLMLGRMPAPMT